MSDSEVSEMDFQSEDGEIKVQKSPLGKAGKDRLRQELPFSVSDDDAEDTTDSLDIKPPQANVHSLKSRSHREKHSHREKERRSHANGHMSHSRPEERLFKKEHHRSREERYREYRDEHHREREKRHHREKHGDVIEAKRERLDFGIDDLRRRDEAFRSYRGETTGTSYRDAVEGRRGDAHGVREFRDARDPQDLRELREARDSREFQELRDRERKKAEKREERSKDRVHKERILVPNVSSDQKLDDLRERILDRRREGEAHHHHERERLKQERREVKHQLQQLERRHQKLEEQHQQQALEDQILPPIKETPQERAEREERESRKLKLLEAEKEMIRQKEVFRRELEARRARRQVEEEKEGTLESIAMKSDSFERMQIPDDDSVVVLSDASEAEMHDDKDENLNHRGESKKRTHHESGSGESDATSNSSSEDDDTDETESDGRASDAEDNEVTGNKNGNADGHIDRSHSDNDFAPVENGNVSSPPILSVEADGQNDLPSYLPAIQGCRSIKEYDYLNRIEEGTYGIVYRACEKRTGEIVALKRLKMEREKEGFPITSLREINTLLKAQHKNIVTVREIVLDSSMEKIFIVMDYVAHDMKSLMETMKHKKQVFLTGEVKCLMQQLLRAVHHMHDNWILHRDLKTSNLLLSHDGILKVGDFGLAREYGSPLKNYTEIVVTLWYRAPELLLGTKEYSTHIDMWSVGCIFAEFLLMEALFPGKSEMDQIKRIFKELGTPNEDIWPGYNQLPHVQKCNFASHSINNLRKRFHTMLTELGLDLLNKFLTYDPVQRITADKALDHQYFKEVPLAIDPAMFPTWPAKSEGYHRKAASPKAPSGGKEYKELGDGDDDVSAMGFHMGTTEMERTRLAVGAGFSLRF